MDNPRKRLFLHVGHGKTGTSAIQAFLARTHEKLKERGYLYPYHPSFSKALKGHISCGNVAVSPDSASWFEDIIEIVEEESAYHTFIFSGESMFGDMDRVIDSFAAIREAVDLKIVMAVRNPLDMLSSEYQQSVKRGGEIISYKLFLESRGFICGHTARAAELVAVMESKGIPYELFNYSVIGRNIVAEFISRIGLPVSYEPEEIGTVNRSLTGAELLMTRVINALLGRVVGMKITDALVNGIPSLKSESPLLDEKSRCEIEKNMLPHIQNLNKFLPADMPLSLEKPNQHIISFSDVDFALSDDQREVARRQLANSFYPKDAAQVLRSVAQKYVTSEKITKQEAIALLRIAMKANPKSAKRIKIAIREMESRL